MRASDVAKASAARIRIIKQSPPRMHITSVVCASRPAPCYDQEASHPRFSGGHTAAEEKKQDGASDPICALMIEGIRPLSDGGSCGLSKPRPSRPYSDQNRRSQS